MECMKSHNKSHRHVARHCKKKLIPFIIGFALARLHGLKEVKGGVGISWLKRVCILFLWPCRNYYLFFIFGESLGPVINFPTIIHSDFMHAMRFSQFDSIEGNKRALTSDGMSHGMKNKTRIHRKLVVCKKLLLMVWSGVWFLFLEFDESIERMMVNGC